MRGWVPGSKRFGERGAAGRGSGILPTLKKLGGGRFRDPGFFLPAGFSLHKGGLGVICTYGDCGGNGKFADREGR